MRVAESGGFVSQFVPVCGFVFAAALVPVTTHAEAHAECAPAMLKDAL